MELRYIGPLIILVFLLITYVISAFEKINQWKATRQAFLKMFQKTFISKISIPLLMFIVIAEIIIVTYAGLGIYDILVNSNFDFAVYSCIASSILCSIFLLGLRLIEDYQGSARVGIYFLISILGIYWIQSMFLIDL